MIYDSLKHMEAYQGVHPGIYKGLELLRDTDFSKLEDARVEVDGEDLFYLLQSYESKPTNDTPEAHKKYVDIQFLISGREKMGVGALEDMKEEVEAHPDRKLLRIAEDGIITAEERSILDEILGELRNLSKVCFEVQAATEREV